MQNPNDRSPALPDDQVTYTLKLRCFRIWNPPNSIFALVSLPWRNHFHEAVLDACSGTTTADFGFLLHLAVKFAFSRIRISMTIYRKQTRWTEFGQITSAYLRILPSSRGQTVIMQINTLTAPWWIAWRVQSSSVGTWVLQMIDVHIS